MDTLWQNPQFAYVLQNQYMLLQQQQYQQSLLQNQNQNQQLCVEGSESEADEDNNNKRILFVGNLHAEVNNKLIYEVFVHAGPIESIKRPKDNGRERSYAFVYYKHQSSVPYALQLFDGLNLYHKQVHIKNRCHSEPAAKRMRLDPAYDNLFNPFSFNNVPSFSGMPQQHQQQQWHQGERERERERDRDRDYDYNRRKYRNDERHRRQHHRRSESNRHSDQHSKHSRNY